MTQPVTVPKITRHSWGYKIIMPCQVCGWPMTRHLDLAGIMLPRQPIDSHDGPKHGLTEAAPVPMITAPGAIRCGEPGCPGSEARGLAPSGHTCQLGKGLHPLG